MKNHIALLRRYLMVVLVLCMLLSGCANAAPAETEATAEPTIATEPVETTEATEPPQVWDVYRDEEATGTITVAMYPWVPDVELFKDVLRQEWAKMAPNVTLEIEEWDCYVSTSDCDVLMYDALILTQLVENGIVQPVALDEFYEADGLIPFALEGALHNGEYYGVPYFLCGDVLIYYEDDADMAEVDSIPDLHAIAQERMQKDENAGVVVSTMIDTPYRYLDALVDVNGEYSMYEELPDCNNLNDLIMERLEDLNEMAVGISDAGMGTADAAEMFNEGTGFAFFGVTEKMSFMDDIVDKLDVKPISYAKTGNVPMYYVDLASINSHVTDPKMLELCKKLINLIGSEEFMEALLLNSNEAQYLLPARESVYLTLEEKYPAYADLRKVAMDERNKTYRVGKDFYDFMMNFPRLVEGSDIY